MRLLDQVVRLPGHISARDSAGVDRRLTSVGGKADIIAECSLRYILDETVAKQCMDLIRADSDLLYPENRLLRIPGELFWVEWPGERPDSNSGESKMAALVEASPCGRRGTVTGFWENASGHADLTVVATEFDLDHPLRSVPGSRQRIQIRHAGLPHLDKLFQHALLSVDSTWLPFLESRGDAGFWNSIQELSDAAWFNLPFVLSFAALLNSDNILDERPSDFSRLNLVRSKRGQQPLLDHVEVRMKLGPREASGTSGHLSSGRTPPRLHYVRGHVVSRSGNTFWRAPHLRGDHYSPMLSKTVLVSGRAPAPLHIARA